MLPIEDSDAMQRLLDQTADELAPIERLVLGPRTPPELAGAVDAARARAANFRAGLENPGRVDLLAIVFVADLLGRVWLESRWDAGRMDRLVRDVADLTETAPDVVRMSLFSHLVRDEQLFELPPKLAIETQLEILAVLGPLTETSLWVVSSESGKVSRVLAVGDGGPGRRARAAAAETIAKNDFTTSERALIHAAPLRRWNQPRGAVVGKSRGEDRRDALAYLAEAALAIGPFLEIESLLDRNAEHERSLVESSERLLVRLGFDLHDGPMQDIAALAQDVRFFRSQLAPFLESLPESQFLLGRFDDVDARLVALDRDLRDIARSLDAPALSRLPFPDALEYTIGEFERRTGVEVVRSESGDFGGMTSSQRIALLRVIQEALNNVHEHSRAKRAKVRVNAGRARLSAQVYDEGSGFDVEERLVQAAKAGRLGLVGMSERIRLLGGKLEIDSKPRGPTRVTASIPRWQPLAPP